MTFLVSVCGQEWNIKKLPSFHSHYRLLGVEQFFIILNNYNGVIPVDAPDIEYFHWNEEFNEEKRIRLEQQIVQDRCGLNDWVVYADPDELQVPMEKYDKYNNHTWLGGELVDVPTDGFIKKFGSNIITPDFTSRCGAWTKKICACRGKFRLGLGHHMFEGERYNPNLETHITIMHYKWDEYILEKIDVESTFKDPQLRYWRKELQKAKEIINEHKTH